MRALEHTPGNYYNFHPGSHVQQGVQTGVALITAQLNSVLLPEQRTMVLLETMAEGGSKGSAPLRSCVQFLDGVALDEKKWACVWTPAMCGTAATTLSTIWTAF